MANRDGSLWGGRSDCGGRMESPPMFKWRFLDGALDSLFRNVFRGLCAGVVFRLGAGDGGTTEYGLVVVVVVDCRSLSSASSMYSEALASSRSAAISGRSSE